MKEFNQENIILRRLLWLRHGCDIHCLYGDDGEMQCGSCMIDFKRDSIEKIEYRFSEVVKQRFFKALRELNKKNKK